MSKIIGDAIVVIGGGKPTISASTTAKSGVTYTNDIHGISAERMSSYAKAISNNKYTAYNNYKYNNSCYCI